MDATSKPTETPSPRGRILLETPRGPDEKLIVSLDEYNGFPYVSLRVWKRGTGGYWPDKTRGLSIKTRELRELAAALLNAATPEAP